MKKKSGNTKVPKMIALLIVAAMLVLSACGSGNGQNTAGKVEETTPIPADQQVEETPEVVEETQSVIESQIEDIMNTSLRSEVTFGRYEQDGDFTNGEEDITWIVIGEENGKKLLLSKYVLLPAIFDEDVTDKIYTWEDSLLRHTLNGEFYDSAFNEEEKAFIQLSDNITEVSTYSESTGEMETDEIHTNDYVFVMSEEENEKYLTVNPKTYWFQGADLIVEATPASGVKNEENEESADEDALTEWIEGSSYDMEKGEWIPYGYTEEDFKKYYPESIVGRPGANQIIRGNFSSIDGEGNYINYFHVYYKQGGTSSPWGLWELSTQEPDTFGARPAIWIAK